MTNIAKAIVRLREERRDAQNQVQKLGGSYFSSGKTYPRLGCHHSCRGTCIAPSAFFLRQDAGEFLSPRKRVGPRLRQMQESSLNAGRAAGCANPRARLKPARFLTRNAVFPCLCRLQAVKPAATETSLIPVLAVPSAQFPHDAADKCLGVAEQHQVVIEIVERVIDAREARIHAALDDHHGMGLVHIQNRHPVDGTGSIGASRRIGDVVGADHQGNIGLRESRR